MPDIEMLRRFAGADPEVDGQLLQMCLAAAVEWYKRAGVPPPSKPTESEEGEDNSGLYDLWVCNLASWFFDNRGAGDETEVPPYIVHSVHQLRSKKGASP